MIAQLRGTVLDLKPPTAIVDVHGVGFRVFCSAAALDTMTIGQACVLHTHLVVREDEWSLYGFADEGELSLFQLLLTVPGVGARTALAILSRLSGDALRAAIANQQHDTLASVPGIGRKTAEKIIFALRDKVGGLEAVPAISLSASDAEVIAALTALGYSVTEAQRALASLPRNQPMDLEEKIRRALAYFG
ncbi:MAG: Holliday junction branch migration protein RuvA [Anaerolineae bacterium]|nr:Holliday junction branch migration protein RuvA [Anaerolineae bacterium]